MLLNKRKLVCELLTKNYCSTIQTLH